MKKEGPSHRGFTFDREAKTYLKRSINRIYQGKTDLLLSIVQNNSPHVRAGEDGKYVFNPETVTVETLYDLQRILVNRKALFGK